jgi:uncharacterized protein (TIGR03067 family)
MFRLALMTLFASCLVALAQEKKVDAKDDAKALLEKLAGTWKVEKEICNGAESKDADIQLIFMGEKVTLQEGDRASAAKVSIDATKKPTQLDVTPEGSDRTIQAIFELDGDTLKLAFIKDGGGRPEKFESTPGSKVTLATLKRVKTE